jgi:diaminopimelate decarboxylase
VSTHPFDYRGQHLHCEGVAIEALAAAHGTPLYVYSRGSIEAAYRAYAAALAGVRHAICYSVKANSSLGILGVLAGLGAGADIVSGGELVRWQRAGGDARKVVFSGVGKTRGEIEAALAAQIRAFNVESAEELALIDEVATAHGVRAPVALSIPTSTPARTRTSRPASGRASSASRCPKPATHTGWRHRCPACGWSASTATSAASSQDMAPIVEAMRRGF